MSRRGKKRELLAPSLFPFLAVLLCTMGALVLILMLVVGQAQATAREVTTSKKEQTEELEAQIELVKQSLEKERIKLQLELEKKRLTLQSFEVQIQQSLDELKKYSRTAELIESQSTEIEHDSQNAAEKISTLEKQLAEAAEKLKLKLEKPTGKKPVFAIIPYEGSSGTHRRPIYLECTADGVVVQPEGVLIGLSDLRPPYGPGNPLDAALRTVRNRYAPANGALTSSAYPLLVVRPSGIQTYALARLAMAGWDDQFGYELVEGEMELAFPEGESGLRAEIEQSLVMARNRQAALVLAMPGKYRSYIEAFDDEPYNPLGSSGGGFDAAAGDDGQYPSGQSIDGNDARRGDNSDDKGYSVAGLAESRGGFAFDSTMVTGSGALSFEKTLPDASGQPNSQRSEHPIANLGFGGPKASTSDSAAAQPKDASSSFRNLLEQAQMKGEGHTQGGSLSSKDSNQSRESSGSEIGKLDDSAGGQGSQNQHARSLSSRKTAQVSRTSGGGSQVALDDAAEIESPFQTGATSPSMDSEQQSQSVPGVSMNLRSQEKSESVPDRKGRSWAGLGQSTQGTAVVRSIRVACYRDKWVVQPEKNSSLAPATIVLGGPLRSSTEQLAEAIADRVDRWGVALAGGYWKPVLIVDVAYGGEARFKQLVKLLEGSGIQIQRSSESP